MDMLLTKVGDKYIWKGGYSTRHTPKSAQFRWDPDGNDCGFPKRWWTNYIDRAAKLSEYADDTCKAELERTHKKIQKNHELSRAAEIKVTANMPVPEGHSYLPYQKVCIQFCIDKDAVLNADEMGLGKTIETIGAINADASIKKILIMCPAIARATWKKHLEEWLVNKDLTIEIAHKKELPSADIVIMSMDVSKKYHDGIRARQWDLFVFDECHFLKNPKTQRSLYVIGGKFSKGKGKDKIEFEIEPIKARKRMMLTGTPILNRPIEIWPILNYLDPENPSWKNFFGFAKRFCGAFRSQWGWDMSGATHLEELQEKMRASVMIRRLKKDVLTDLPGRRRQIITLENVLDKDQMREQDLMWKALRGRVNDIYADFLDEEAFKAKLGGGTDGLKIEFAQMARVRKETAIAKTPQVIAHLNNLFEEDPDRKIVCFAHHHKVMEMIKEEFGNKAVVVNSSVPDKQRQSNIEAFMNNPQVKLFIGGIKSAGTNITLTVANIAVFAEIDWVPGNVRQAEDRIHRIGQTQPCLFQHLHMENTIDYRMAEFVIRKQEIADKSTDVKIKTEAISLADSIKKTKDEIKEDVNDNRKSNNKPSGKEIITRMAAKMDDKTAEAVHKALRIISGYDDDYASERNGIGFNKMDTVIGNDLANLQNLSKRQAALGYKIIKKYRRQLPEDLRVTLGIA